MEWVYKHLKKGKYLLLSLEDTKRVPTSNNMGELREGNRNNKSLPLHPQNIHLLIKNYCLHYYSYTNILLPNKLI